MLHSVLRSIVSLNKQNTHSITNIIRGIEKGKCGVKGNKRHIYHWHSDKRLVSDEEKKKAYTIFISIGMR